MEWIQQNLLLCAGIAGFVLFLLAGWITAAVLKKKRARIEQAIVNEYEQARESSAG